jgi:hypothetical protein
MRWSGAVASVRERGTCGQRDPDDRGERSHASSSWIPGRGKRTLGRVRRQAQPYEHWAFGAMIGAGHRP